MTIAYQLEPRGRLAILQVIDAVTPADWNQAVAHLLADPRFTPGCPVLVDRRREDAIDRSQSLLRMVQLIEAHANPLALSKWAMVVDPSNTEAYGVGRLTVERQSIRHVDVEAFAGIEYAVRWVLGDRTDWVAMAEICIWALKTAPADPFIINRMRLGITPVDGLLLRV